MARTLHLLAWISVVGACSLQLTNAGVTKTDDPKIVYPGPIQDLSNRHGSLSDTSNETDPCKDLTFCTIKPKDYPQELFNRLFKGKYKEPIFQPTYISSVNRQGDPDEVDNCESIVTFEPLYRVRTELGDWFTVVQAPEENYLQMVRLETCETRDKPCFTSFEAPIDLQAACKQKYSVWEFLVHDGKEGTEKITVDLPICCSCHYKPINI